MVNLVALVHAFHALVTDLDAPAARPLQWLAAHFPFSPQGDHFADSHLLSLVLHKLALHAETTAEWHDAATRAAIVPPLASREALRRMRREAMTASCIHVSG